MRRKKKLARFLPGGGCASGALLLLLPFAGDVMAGEALPLQAIHKCKRHRWGTPAPEIRKPQEAADHLRRTVNFRPWRVHRYVVSFFTTNMFKRNGLYGWTDYCSQVSVDGWVLHANMSADRFSTVDLELRRFAVNGVSPVLDGTRFLRMEIPPGARKKGQRLPRVGEFLHASGKLMWDADGFLEIHARSPEDITLLHPALGGPEPSEYEKRRRHRSWMRRFVRSLWILQ